MALSLNELFSRGDRYGFSGLGALSDKEETITGLVEHLRWETPGVLTEKAASQIAVAWNMLADAEEILDKRPPSGSLERGTAAVALESGGKALTSLLSLHSQLASQGLTAEASLVLAAHGELEPERKQLIALLQQKVPQKAVSRKAEEKAKQVALRALERDRDAMRLAADPLAPTNRAQAIFRAAELARIRARAEEARKASRGRATGGLAKGVAVGAVFLLVGWALWKRRSQ